MKTKCNQGCVYWDESSRGYHSNEGRTPYKRGRWVGERMVDGRRVRMRSVDYDKVLQWLNGATKSDDLLTLKGFDYSVDTKRNKLYNRYGREVKGRMNKGIRMYQLYKNGERLCEVSFNRLAYAALQRATDVAEEGIEMFLKNAMYREAPLTNITPNIIRRCNIVVANGKRKMEYKE